MVILLHSSKTMRSSQPGQFISEPALLDHSRQLAAYIKTLSSASLAEAMHISPSLADKVYHLYQQWTTEPARQSAAIDSFVGDIYSGLRADSLDQPQRRYAQQHLRILSGLYGILKPLDGIMPYRLEMAYRFTQPPFNNLYNYWGQLINQQISSGQLIVNTSSVEYSQLVTKFHPQESIVTPQFLTVNAATGQPAQVVVHSKIARGAFARWLITSEINNLDSFNQFHDLNYAYDPKLSTPLSPTYVCSNFGGIGLSQRLK